MLTAHIQAFHVAMECLAPGIERLTCLIIRKAALDTLLIGHQHLVDTLGIVGNLGRSERQRFYIAPEELDGGLLTGQPYQGTLPRL